MDGLAPSLKSSHGLFLNWPFLSAIANGESAIDLGGLTLRSLEDAHQFAREYGFDIDRPGVMAHIAGAHREAIEFIVATFLGGDAARIPQEIAAPDDVLRLLVYASRQARQNQLRRAWACAVLKVMHGVFYIDNDLKLRHFDAVREQVFEGLDAVLLEHDGQHFLTDGELRLPIVSFERKNNKGRHSILLKLLQKAAYVAADVCDHLGVRLVFATRFECLLALQLLQRAHLVSVTNVVSQRIRNNLLDFDAARRCHAKYRAELQAAVEYPAALLALIDAEMDADAGRFNEVANPHSAASYRSMQVTLRKMIHVDAVEAGPELSFFFDYEIQLLDRDSYQSSLKGPASHGAYKQRQVETARARVFGPELLQSLGQCSSEHVAA
jgi:uncharacterized protein (TIGR04562 family)